MGHLDQIRDRVVRRSRALGRRRSDVGATLVEYALVFSLLTVAAIPAAQWMTDESRDQVNNEAECVSRRPPPPGCQVPMVTLPPPPEEPGPDDPPDPGDPSDPDPGPEDPPPPPPPPPSDAAWAPGAASSGTPSSWRITASPVVTNEGTPVAGALVQVRINYTDPVGPRADYATCTTDGAGTCTIDWPVPYTDMAEVEMQVTLINSNPPTPAPAYPPALVFAAPGT